MSNIYELILVAIIFCSILVIIFIVQIVLVVKIKNYNDKRFEEIESRINEAERLVRSQVDVNNQVVKLMYSINKILKTGNETDSNDTE